jgi:hypothetical protein
MALSYEEFMAATNAEIVNGNIIVGQLGDRKIVGTHAETFQLNEEGLALQAEIEANPGKKPRAKKAEAPAPAAESAAEPAAEEAK